MPISSGSKDNSSPNSQEWVEGEVMDSKPIKHDCILSIRKKNISSKIKIERNKSSVHRYDIHIYHS